MLRTLWHYLRCECAPRLKRIVFSSQAALSLLVAAFFALFGPKFFHQAPKIGDVTTGLIAYSAIVLGFCVSGLTVSLTLPDREFAAVLATFNPNGEARNAYSDLLFVFSWTAIVHWSAVVLSFVVTLIVESGQGLLPHGCSHGRIVGVAISAGLYTYCFFQFLITLITLSQIGNRYIAHLSRTGDGPEHQDASHRRGEDVASRVDLPRTTFIPVTHRSSTRDPRFPLPSRE